MLDYVFATAKYDYADEFYCEVIFCGSRENFEKLKEEARKFFERLPGCSAWFCFGTNEYLDIPSYQNFLLEYDGVTPKIRDYPISFEEYQKFMKIFDRVNEKGWFVYGTASHVFEIDYWRTLDGSDPY